MRRIGFDADAFESKTSRNPMRWFRRPGFVVNVYDPLSFDIDLNLTSDEIPSGIQSSRYLYKEFCDLGPEKTEILPGRTFRFRLSGIVFRKNLEMSKMSKSLINDLHRYTWSLIHSCDNWVLTNVLGIDTYNRFLGNIILPEIGDLGSHLEQKFPQVVQKYVAFQRSNSKS